MTMKKEYITPEVEVIELASCTVLASSATEVPGKEDDLPLDSRDDYYDNTPSRPGSGNIWDQGW